MVFLASAVVLGSYYLLIVFSVPAKRNLNYKGRLSLYIAQSMFGTANDIIMAIFSVLSCVLFVWETYLPDDDGTPVWMFSTEVVFSTGFALQYFLLLYTAPNVPVFLVSMQAMVDCVTTIPVFVTLFSNQYSLSSGVGFLRFSRVMKFTRVLRLLRLIRSVNVVSSATDNAIRHQMILLISTIVSILVVTTGFVQFLGNEVERGEWGNYGRKVEFHDALYFTVVSFTTVGYGDISPSGAVGRAVMLCIIAVTFVLVPFETSKLVRLTRMRSAYGGRLGRTDGHAHVIVACDVQCAGVADFLKEFFHEDHGGQSTRVVLLAPGEPTVPMKAMLLKHKRVQYLKGDAMSGEDLARVRADTAHACFVLTNRFTADTDETDSITVLRALNVKAFNSQLRTFVQIIEPENIVHVLSAGVNIQNVLCINSVKLGLLGQSCVFPGFSTVITNLVVSVAYDGDSGSLPWHTEYGAGLKQEIYSLHLPKWFEGRSFSDVSLMVYREYAATMFAVGIPAHGTSDIGVQLNPGADFILREGFVAFLITEDQATIQRIAMHSNHAKVPAPSTPSKRTTRRKQLMSAAWTRSRRNLIVPKADAKSGMGSKTSSGSNLLRSGLGAITSLRAMTGRKGKGKSERGGPVKPVPDHGILEAHFTPATRARPKAMSEDRQSAGSRGSSPRHLRRGRSTSESGAAPSSSTGGSPGRAPRGRLVMDPSGARPGPGVPGASMGTAGSGRGVLLLNGSKGTVGSSGSGVSGADMPPTSTGAAPPESGAAARGGGSGASSGASTPSGAGAAGPGRPQFRLPGASRGGMDAMAGAHGGGTEAEGAHGAGTDAVTGAGPRPRLGSESASAGSAPRSSGSSAAHGPGASGHRTSSSSNPDIAVLSQKPFSSTIGSQSVVSASYRTLVSEAEGLFAGGAGAGAGAGSSGHEPPVVETAAGVPNESDAKAEARDGDGGARDVEVALIPPSPGPEINLERKSLKLARATLVQSLTEVIDNMHGTVQSHFIEDLCAVLSTVSIDPREQRSIQVAVTGGTPEQSAGRVRRRSFLDDSVVRQPSFRRRALDDATLANLSSAENPGAAGIKDHVVVVCTTADDLQYLIAPLRSTYLSRMPPVVILCPEAPDERMWAELSTFEDVLYVQGVPHIRDLKRAGIDTAECAVILARNTEPVSSGHFSAQDAEVVLTVLDIQACVSRSIRTLAELNCSRYMKHLGAPLMTRRSMLDRQHGFHHRLESEADQPDDDDSYIFESSYTSGKVLPANFLESLLCQAYFNPYIVLLVTAMIAGCPMGQTQQDKLRRQSFSVHAALPFTHAAPHQAKQCSVRSHGMQIAIPDDFTGTSYGELFEHLMFEYEMVPVALYRYGEGLGNDLPFVFTNPPADTIVTRKLDLVFVFAPCQLGCRDQPGSGGSSVA